MGRNRRPDLATLGGFFQSSGGFSAAPAASTTAYTPLTETDVVFYWDPDAVAAGTLSALTDQSSGAHNLSQGTAGKRAVNTASSFGSHNGLVFPAAANHGGYEWDTPWTKPASGTVYSVVKYNSAPGTYQALYVGDTGGTLGVIMYLSHTGADVGKAATVTGSTNVKTAAMTNGSIHLIKYGWVNQANIYIALDGGAASSTTFDAANQGRFDEIGLSSLDTQDLASTLGPQIVCSGWHDGDAEDVRITNYLKTWAGIA